MKVENYICKKCFEKKKGRILLQDIYPNIMKYWSKELNNQSLDCITVGSEYDAILVTKYGRLCKIKVYKLTNALKKKDFDMDSYLEEIIIKEEKIK